MNESVPPSIPLYPSYLKWSGFLSSQSDHSRVSLPSHNLYTADLETSYKTPIGIKNTVFFHNVDLSKGVNWNPFKITQEYSSTVLGYQVKSSIEDARLSVELKFEQPESKFFDHITVKSFQYPKEKRFKRNLTIKLKSEYRQKLIDQGILQADAGDNIYIREENGVETINIFSKNNHAEVEFSKESLGKILQEIQFQYKMNETETKGQLGDLVFSAANADSLSLNSDNVWNSLTGTQYFIFPVKVNKLPSK